MVGVASQIIFCIFAAAVIGSVAGFLIRGIRHSARIAEVESTWQARLAERDQEMATLRAGVERSGGEQPILLQPKSNAETASDKNVPSVALSSPMNTGQFENKLSEVLSHIEKLAKSQERMEGELAALKSRTDTEFKLEPSQPKS
jgi:hypothetical protein